jgi:RNA polymerase sigma-70 factor (ECF subfamily)
MRAVTTEDLDLERAARGDAEAFARLAGAHRGAVFRCARALTGQDADAWDVAQETFLAAWRALPRFRRDCRFRTWLLRIAASRAANARRARRPVVPLPDDAAARVAPGAEAEERRARLLEAVGTLPPRQREVVALRVFGGLGSAEAGAALGIEPAAVRVHLHHALRRLRQRLEPARARGEMDG